jgi:hypothetical protein
LSTGHEAESSLGLRTKIAQGVGVINVNNGRCVTCWVLPILGH